MTTKPQRRTGRARTIATAAITLILAVGIIAACVITQPWRLIGGATTANTQVDVTTLRTQPVTKGALNAQTRLGASLQYDDAREFAAATGMITQLPVAGKQLNTGDQVYEMDGVPVPLFHGSRPFWRQLGEGAADGPDVAQLEQNLKETGYFTGEPDNHFDWYTKDAIQRWQTKALGLAGDAATGVFDPASVALAAGAPIRIKTVTAKLGDTNVSPATYTGIALHLNATLTATQAATFKAGDKAQVVLPDNTTIDTTLTSVDQGGQAVGTDGQVTQPSARIDFPDQTKVAQYGPTAVQLLIPNAAADGRETLIVPVTALIAGTGNSWAVEVVRGGKVVRIAVTIGTVANAQVQITGSDGLKVGDKVVVS
ncbi:peptidoglycan-binding domain-containing protein [Bifidobacterium leontopitheci]|uniref:Peptidoglycan-binding protein n=1 Tax=Bifidobacterium leontopitheci TaxID=2650774 RepID=A0A6I1GDQ1_9BIFI|nr:peptidoglycan-binding domain-containing protein [Bifidobacterium leontopitheci]KAB7789780.1 peptidoglycan-binding protein [Bifidobacterium leontopitheci]